MTRLEQEEREKWKPGTAFISCLINRGKTRLMRYARDGRIDSVKRLLKRGVNIDKGSVGCNFNLHEAPESGKTALIFAAENGHEQVVQELVNAGVDIVVRTSKGRTAWTFAADNGHFEVLKILWTNAGNQIPQWQVSAFVRKAVHRDPEMVNYLAHRVKNPANLVYSLRSAINHGDPSSIKILLDHGACVTGMVIAEAGVRTWDNRVEVLELLLNHVNSPDLRSIKAQGTYINYVTPLMMVINKIDVKVGFETIDTLISYGADINTFDVHGKSVLDYAIDKGHTGLIQESRKLGAKEGQN